VNDVKEKQRGDRIRLKNYASQTCNAGRKPLTNIGGVRQILKLVA